MSRRARIRAAAMVVMLVLAGAVCAVAVSGTLGQLLAYVCIALALGLVLATAWAFFEVGLSEDRERAAARPRPPRPGPRPGPGRSRPRLPRSDGHRRRL